MKRDIDLILEMNCNTIRGSHYPNSKIFLDMLDEKGILFWSEIPMWGCGFSWELLADPVIIDRGLTMHKEMTKQYYNHPSIIIWGMHNEIDTTKETALTITKPFYEHLRKHGGNRLITHASNHPLYDLCMDYDDIICLNVYYGWYKGSLDVWDKFVVDFKNRLMEKNWFGKPVIMSEFGAAALAGFHSHFDTVRWSEEYQRDLLEYTIELFHKTDYMRGTYVWQFCNIRTSPEMDINRARYFNNKGIIDEYRNPKAAFFKVKELYGKYSKEQK
jgi:beta-glucuronidase